MSVLRLCNRSERSWCSDSIKKIVRGGALLHTYRKSGRRCTVGSHLPGEQGQWCSDPGPGSMQRGRGQWRRSTLIHTYRESEGSGARIPGQVQCRRCEGGGGTPEDDSGHQQLARIDAVDQQARGELEGRGGQTGRPAKEESASERESGKLCGVFLAFSRQADRLVA